MIGLSLLAAIPAWMAAALIAAPPQSQCSLSPSDQAWLDQTMDAWNDTSMRITNIGHVKRITAVFFDDDCMITSSTAMNGGPRAWTSRPFKGQVPLPTGQSIPAGVISFAMSEKNGDDNHFVMSTPSIWRAANKPDNGLGSLETLMTHVVLHEGTHVAQMPTYGKRMERLAAANNLPESFNDDSIQERFEADAEFTASIAEETRLWIAAAKAKDDGQAVASAREARAKMLARQKRWFTGKDAYLTEAEDIWLTMEGSAQWAGYAWLVDPAGGRLSEDVAFQSFTKGKWWSQVEGFAMFMALDRIAGAGWRSHAYGDGSKTLIEMLDEAITPRA